MAKIGADFSRCLLAGAFGAPFRPVLPKFAPVNGIFDIPDIFQQLAKMSQFKCM